MADRPLRRIGRVMALAVLGSAASVPAIRAEDGHAFGFCADGIQVGWNFYCDPARKPKPPAPKPDPRTAPEADPLPPPYPATEAIAKARKELDELKNRAILEPSPANLSAYMFAQKAMVDQAGRFADVWERVLFRTPDLDANQTYPLSQMGGEVFQDEKRLKWEAALRQAADNLGFMVVVTDEKTCPLCAKELEVIKLMEQNYGITPLVVTKDGSAHPLYPDARADQGQLRALGLETRPTPFIALVEPRSGRVEPLGSGLLTEDVILERVFVVSQVPEGQRYVETP